jgi:fatty-acyl-CoA synthase
MTTQGTFFPHAKNFGLGSWPARRALLEPTRVAWTFEGTATTFHDVDVRTRKLARALIATGIEPGDRIGYIGFNHPALLEFLFAAGRIGAVAVLINARLSAGEVNYIAQDSGIRLLAFGAEQTSVAENVVAQVGLRYAVNVDEVKDLEAWSVSYESFMDSGNTEDVLAPVELDDPCLIMYTSGTTGRPKGAVLSHANMFFSATNVLLSTDVRPDDVCLAVSPLFHIAGLNGLVLPVFLKGGHNIIHRTFSPTGVIETLRTENVTSMFAVPAMLEALGAVPEFSSTPFPAMRTLIGGGAPFPERTLKMWNSKGVKVLQGYGFTEAAPAVTLLSSEFALEKEGSAGKPQFFMDVRLAKPDGTDAQPGETGELLARGMNIMLGYWNNAEATASSFTGDWYHSGDLASIDDDGFYFLRDRTKDMYISGGENVYPTEVESALLNVPGVAEAAVIGVADAKWGEVGRAFVVTTPGAELSETSIIESVSANLARYKLPKKIVFTDSLPRNTLGKLQKHLLPND